MKKRRRGKNYFHKETEGRRSRKPTSTDGNAVKMIFDCRTFSFFKLIDYKICFMYLREDLLMLEWIKKHRIVISVLFFVFASVLSHIRYILGDAEFFFSVNTDSFSQLIRMTPFLEDNILDSQWSWSYGLGGDIFSEFSYYYTTSPFFICGCF